MKNLLFTLVFVGIFGGCASVGMLPKNSNEVNFDGVEGKTGWSQYQHNENFNNTTIDNIYDAAKIGLGNAGFSLRKADKSMGYVIGEHGMTAHDWNVIVVSILRNMKMMLGQSDC
jgi:hypothetical protein